MSLGPGNGRDRSLHQLHQVEGGAGGFSSTWTPGRGPEEQPALEKIEAILNSEPLAEVQKKNLKLKGGRQCPEMANIYQRRHNQAQRWLTRKSLPPSRLGMRAPTLGRGLTS